MIEFTYLYQGICGLAHAHRAGTMAGHLGAAVAAGYFFGEDQGDLPDAVFRGVEGELDRIMRGEEAIWFNARRAGLTPAELFQPLPQEQADEQKIGTIAEALGQNVAQMRQSGHNVIFASIALRALHDHGEYATPTAIEGVRKLTLGFNNAHPGRGYYGKDEGWKTGNQVQLQPDAKFPPYKNLHALVHTTIDELIATAAIKRQGFGGLWHIINHAAAIVELDRLGYEELAEKALPAHHQHIQLWRTLPNVQDELGAQTKSAIGPLKPEYWDGMLRRDQALLTHRIKTMYGYYTLRGWLEDEAHKQKADAAFLYLLD